MTRPTLLANIALWLLLLWAALIFIWAAIFAAIDKEAERAEAVRDYNCQHYGAAINRFYDSEVCPPTQHG